MCGFFFETTNDIELVSKEEATEFHFDNATGTFNELYSKLEQEPIKKKKLYGKSLNMSEIEKEYSFLNRWFIFKKI